ncbi:IucA/IucC family C-terminal-domain containing protein [Sutcliffiella deserti]|uniref:IucA/IucC family C-terminal-domain containing protein n=1 Tax=Sutcliffiella deserti TaxID=2875501 RepID=UPI001CBB381D|nr:IucA/IucC family C-terminal-domain containing protein [Sutcliffiella deserti]
MSREINLTITEQDFLKDNCRLTVGEQVNKPTISLSSLIEHGTKDYLSSIQGALGANQLDVAASLLMKRLGFIAVNCFYSMTAFDKALKVAPENIWIDSSFEKKVWLPKIRFYQLKAVEPMFGERDKWREATFKQLFQTVYAPLIEQLAKDAKVSRQTLWENVMLYIYWLYETVLPKMNVTTNLQEDFQSLLQAPPSIFNMNRNPAAFFYKEKTFVKKHQTDLRVRTTCCFYYKANKEGSHCSTCPLECKGN